MARGKAKTDDLMTLQMALVGYEIERQKIDERIKEIQAKIGKRRPAAAAGAAVEEAPRKRVLSPEARRRIALAQKRRWAEHRKKAASKGESKS